MHKRELVPGYAISPVIKGGWQLSEGHSLQSAIATEQAVADTVAFIEAGISTLDFGDIYTGVEEIIGQAVSEVVKRHGPSGRDLVQLHTKYVPNKTLLTNFDLSDVEKVVDRSLYRLGVEQVDLVQFHWWTYEANHYLEALAELFRLKKIGKIKNVGVTNFDSERMAEMVAEGLTPASIQLQYSVLDRRPEEGMVEFCESHGIGILCYGSVAGGFLSNRYLGSDEPIADETRSNTKYHLIIDEFGGWNLFQELLSVLHQISLEHQTDIASIASAFVLRKPAVKGAIVGARNLAHLVSNLQIPNIQLSPADLAAIQVVLSKSEGPTGEVYGLERYSQRHHNIMHTNLN